MILFITKNLKIGPVYGRRIDEETLAKNVKVRTSKKEEKYKLWMQ